MKHTTNITILFSLFLALCLTTSPATAQSPSKKFIEWSAVEPNTTFLRQHADRFPHLPFDGFVFRITTPTGEQMMWNMWSDRKYEEHEFAHCLEELDGLDFGHLTDRFLRINITPGNVRWDDDQTWAIITHNAALAARLARKMHCVGLLFDTEQYAARPFDTTAATKLSGLPLDQLTPLARSRGSQWMNAINQEFPGITLLMTFGYKAAQVDEVPGMRVGNYELLAPFLDGMLETADDQTKIIDGWEYSYAYKTDNEFAAARKTILETAPTWSALPDEYRTHISPAFAVWLDYAFQDTTWDTTDFTRNFHSPASFQYALQSAAKHSERYVWVYSDRPNWWTGENLPTPYVDSLKKAHNTPLLP